MDEIEGDNAKSEKINVAKTKQNQTKKQTKNPWKNLLKLIYQRGKVKK